MSQIAANEITLHYESAGQGQPLLFITGVGYGAWFWHKLTPDLSHHFQVDLRPAETLQVILTHTA